MAKDGFAFRSKTETVQEYVLSKIRSGEIQPGQRLQQDVLAEELGVSSTPVREALRRLEAEGLVTHVPNKGVTVSDADSPEVREAYAIRALLEGHATRLAATRLSEQELDLLKSLHVSMRELRSVGDLHACSAINDRWHVTIYRASGSKLLEKMIRMAWTACPLDAIWSVAGRSTSSISEHERVMNALLARDADEADRAMADHIRGGERTVLKYIRNEESTRRSPVALSTESQQTESLR